MKSYKPDRRSLTTLKILVLAAAVLLIVMVRTFIKIYVLALILSIVFAAAAVIVVFAYLPHYFLNLSYCANESEIKKSSGVFFKASQSIKYSSIQYSTYISVPFSKFTGFNFIVFYVYGGRLILLFLKRSDADEILKNSGCLYCRED